MFQSKNPYPPIAIGCCFYKRSPNYQKVITSIENMATAYGNEVKAFIYLSGETDEGAQQEIGRISFRLREIFDFQFGPNRIDEPKYKLPLASEFPFIFTTDDDRIFGEDTLTILMDAYNQVQAKYPENGYLSPVGWFGTEIENGELMTPINDRYRLTPGELQQVDYIGSCGCLFRREVLEDETLRYENWPSFIGDASDVWLSYLIVRHYHTPIFITGVHTVPLPEHGHSLFEETISKNLPALVERLVADGWKV